MSGGMRVFYLLGYCLAALFLQMTVFSAFAPGGIIPYLVLLPVVFAAFWSGRGEGALLGLWSGFLVDIAAGYNMGQHALATAATGYLVGLAHNKIYKESAVLLTLLTFLATVVHQLFYYLLLGLSGVAVSPALALGRVIFPTALYTAAFVPLLFRHFYRWLFRYRWREQEY